MTRITTLSPPAKQALDSVFSIGLRLSAQRSPERREAFKFALLLPSSRGLGMDQKDQKEI